MTTETITDRPDLLIRRLVLEPGEATPWHVDRCHRFSVVVRGERLRIELATTGDADEPDAHEVPVEPGLAEWDEPTDAVHRAVNTGDGPYEEVVTFFRSTPNEDPQPAR